MAQVPYTADGNLHWVSVYGSVDEKGYINVDGQKISLSDGFLIHSWAQIENPNINDAFSWGCQILNNEDFADFRNILDEMGFVNGDAIPFTIKKFD